MAWVMAMGISMVALAGADDPTCPTGGVWYMQECDHIARLIDCLNCCATYSGACPNSEEAVLNCEELCRTFNNGV